MLSEEYDPSAARMLGNFPQAFSHVSLINTAANLSTPRGPSLMRSGRGGVGPTPSALSANVGGRRLGIPMGAGGRPRPGEHERPVDAVRVGKTLRHARRATVAVPEAVNVGMGDEMAAETPTIVLVHGAWADATGFDAEIRALGDRGYPAIGFGNPLRDLAGDAAYLAEFLRTLSGPIVLVGHSYGGNVISAAAIGNEQVQALVYLNGWMCDVGESQQQLLEQFEGSLVGPSIRPVPFTNPDGSQGTDLYLAREAFREAFAADVDPETAAVMAATQRPYAVAAFAATPSSPPAWKTLPCWYLLGTEDKAIPPALQRFMAERANATIVEVPASHVSFVSQPEAATQLIVQAVEATAAAG